MEGTRTNKRVTFSDNINNAPKPPRATKAKTRTSILRDHPIRKVANTNPRRSPQTIRIDDPSTARITLQALSRPLLQRRRSSVEDIDADFRTTLKNCERQLGNLAIDQIQDAADMPHLASLFAREGITNQHIDCAQQELLDLPRTQGTTKLSGMVSKLSPGQRQELEELHEQVLQLAKEKVHHVAANHLAHAHRENRSLSPDERKDISEACRQLNHWIANLNGAPDQAYEDTGTLIDTLKTTIAEHAPEAASRTTIDKLQDFVRHWVMYSYARAFFIDNPVIMEGIENVPKAGRVLAVLNHGTPIFDTPMGLRLIEQALERPMHYMIDKAMIYKAPVAGLSGGALCLACLFHGFETSNPSLIALGAMGLGFFGWIAGLGLGVNASGCKPASPSSTNNGQSKELVSVVLPGGMRESFRKPEEGMVMRWEKSDGTLRNGVGRSALQNNSYVIPISCSAAEPATGRLYDTYPNELSLSIYQQYKLPFLSTTGRVGQHLPPYLKPLYYEFPFFGLPKPNLIRPVVGKGFYPPPMPGDAAFDSQDRQFLDLATVVTRQIIDALHDGLEYGERKDNPDYAAKTPKNFLRYQSHIQAALHINDQLHTLAHQAENSAVGREVLTAIIRELCTATYTHTPRTIASLDFDGLKKLAIDKLKTTPSLSPLQIYYLWDRSLVPTLSKSLGKETVQQLLADASPHSHSRALQNLDRVTTLLNAHNDPNIESFVSRALKESNSVVKDFSDLRAKLNAFKTHNDLFCDEDHREQIYHPLAAICTAISENWFNAPEPLLETLHLSLSAASLHEHVIENIQRVADNREQLLTWMNTLSTLHDQQYQALLKALTISLCNHLGEELSHSWNTVTVTQYTSTLINRLKKLSTCSEESQADAFKKLSTLLSLHGSDNCAQYLWENRIASIRTLDNDELRQWLNKNNTKQNDDGFSSLLISPLMPICEAIYPDIPFDRAIKEILHPNGGRQAGQYVAKIIKGLLWSDDSRPYLGQQLAKWSPAITEAKWSSSYARKIEQCSPQYGDDNPPLEAKYPDTANTTSHVTKFSHAAWNANHIDKLEPAGYQSASRTQGPLALGPTWEQNGRPKLKTPPSMLSAHTSAILNQLGQAANAVASLTKGKLA